jgi:hypothetical protein
MPPPEDLERPTFDDDDDDLVDEEQAVEQMLELVAYVAKNLVDEVDAVQVQAVDGDRAVVFELTVAQKDLGKVIGRDGRTARAIRTLLAATSAKLRKRAVLEILE